MPGSLSIISANVRGFQTNIGDLTYKFIIPHNPDIIATVETFLNPDVPATFGKVNGYTRLMLSYKHMNASTQSM